MHEQDIQAFSDSLEFHLVNPTKEEEEVSRRELERQRALLDPYLEVFVDGFLSHAPIGFNYMVGAKELASRFLPWKVDLEKNVGARGSVINDAVRAMNMGNVLDYAERKTQTVLNGRENGVLTRGNLAYLRGCAQLAQMKLTD